MFEQKELEILEVLENDQLIRSVNGDEEIVLAKKAAKEYLLKPNNITLRLRILGDMIKKAYDMEMREKYGR